MGYFAAMTRQTGITFGGPPPRPAPAARGVEVIESRTAELLAAPSNSPAPVLSAQAWKSSEMISETRVGSSGIGAALVREERHGLANPNQRVEILRGELASVHEFVVNVDATVLDVNSQRDQKAPARSSPPAELNSEPSTGKADDQHEQSREQARPTMADVRSWVAEPLKQLAELQALEAVPSRPLPVSDTSAGESVEPPREVYTLEIGSLEIVMDSPSVSQPHPQLQAAAPVERSGARWNEASRHYLRF
jgi:hypothetical protein